MQQIIQGKISSRKYEVPICDVYPLNPGPGIKENFQRADSSEDEYDTLNMTMKDNPLEDTEGIQDDILPGNDVDKESAIEEAQESQPEISTETQESQPDISTETHNPNKANGAENNTEKCHPLP